MMYDHLYVALLTSPAPWHPDVTRTMRVVESIWKMLGEQVFIRVFCDGPPPWLSKDERTQYDLYLKLLDGYSKLDLHRQTDHVGILGQMRSILQDNRKTVVMVNQDDLEYIGTHRVDFHRLYRSMVILGEPAYVRFCHVDIKMGKRHVGAHIRPTITFAGLSLTPTIAWVDGACMGTASHYQAISQYWNRQTTICDGRHDVEKPVFKELKRQAKRDGWEQTQRKWGTYLYGSIGDGRYVQLIGDQRTAWREAKGIYESPSGQTETSTHP